MESTIEKKKSKVNMLGSTPTKAATPTAALAKKQGKDAFDDTKDYPFEMPMLNKLPRAAALSMIKGSINQFTANHEFAKQEEGSRTSTGLTAYCDEVYRYSRLKGMNNEEADKVRSDLRDKYKAVGAGLAAEPKEGTWKAINPSKTPVPRSREKSIDSVIPPSSPPLPAASQGSERSPAQRTLNDFESTAKVAKRLCSLQPRSTPTAPEARNGISLSKNGKRPREDDEAAARPKKKRKEPKTPKPAKEATEAAKEKQRSSKKKSKVAERAPSPQEHDEDVAMRSRSTSLSELGPPANDDRAVFTMNMGSPSPQNGIDVAGDSEERKKKKKKKKKGGEPEIVANGCVAKGSNNVEKKKKQKGKHRQDVPEVVADSRSSDQTGETRFPSPLVSEAGWSEPEDRPTFVVRMDSPKPEAAAEHIHRQDYPDQVENEVEEAFEDDKDVLSPENNDAELLDDSEPAGRTRQAGTPLKTLEKTQLQDSSSVKPSRKHKTNKSSSQRRDSQTAKDHVLSLVERTIQRRKATENGDEQLKLQRKEEKKRKRPSSVEETQPQQQVDDRQSGPQIKKEKNKKRLSSVDATQPHGAQGPITATRTGNKASTIPSAAAESRPRFENEHFKPKKKKKNSEKYVSAGQTAPPRTLELPFEAITAGNEANANMSLSKQKTTKEPKAERRKRKRERRMEKLPSQSVVGSEYHDAILEQESLGLERVFTVDNQSHDLPDEDLVDRHSLDNGDRVVDEENEERHETPESRAKGAFVPIQAAAETNGSNEDSALLETEEGDMEVDTAPREDDQDDMDLDVTSREIPNAITYVDNAVQRTSEPRPIYNDTAVQKTPERLPVYCDAGVQTTPSLMPQLLPQEPLQKEKASQQPSPTESESEEEDQDAREQTPVPPRPGRLKRVSKSGTKSTPSSCRSFSSAAALSRHRSIKDDEWAVPETDGSSASPGPVAARLTTPVRVANVAVESPELGSFMSPPTPKVKTTQPTHIVSQTPPRVQPAAKLEETNKDSEFVGDSYEDQTRQAPQQLEPAVRLLEADKDSVLLSESDLETEKVEQTHDKDTDSGKGTSISSSPKQRQAQQAPSGARTNAGIRGSVQRIKDLDGESSEDKGAPAIRTKPVAGRKVYQATTQSGLKTKARQAPGAARLKPAFHERGQQIDDLDDESSEDEQEPVTAQELTPEKVYQGSIETDSEDSQSDKSARSSRYDLDAAAQLSFETEGGQMEDEEIQSSAPSVKDGIDVDDEDNVPTPGPDDLQDQINSQLQSDMQQSLSQVQPADEKKKKGGRGTQRGSAILSPYKKKKKTGKASPHFDSPTPKRKKIPPTEAVSGIPFPSTKAERFGLIQEEVAREPFKLIVAVIFLNQTTGTAAISMFRKVMDTYPTIEQIANADRNEMATMIKPLGLQNTRTKTLTYLAKTWLACPPVKGKRYKTRDYPSREDSNGLKKAQILTDDDPRLGAWEIGHLPGCGPYAYDSWRIFCRDEFRGLANGWNGEGTPEGFQPEWKRVRPTDKELRAYLRWMWLKEGYIWNWRTGETEAATHEELGKAEEGKGGEYIARQRRRKSKGVAQDDKSSTSEEPVSKVISTDLVNGDHSQDEDMPDAPNDDPTDSEMSSSPPSLNGSPQRLRKASDTHIGHNEDEDDSSAQGESDEEEHVAAEAAISSRSKRDALGGGGVRRSLVRRNFSAASEAPRASGPMQEDVDLP